MSGAAVDKHKTPTEEENRNPAWEDEDKDQARKEVVIGLILSMIYFQYSL